MLSIPGNPLGVLLWVSYQESNNKWLPAAGHSKVRFVQLPHVIFFTELFQNVIFLLWVFFPQQKSKQVLDHLENYDVITYLTGFRGRKSMSMFCMGVKGLEEEQEFKQFPRKIILITSYLRIRTDLVSKGRIGCALSLSTVLLIFWEMIYLNRRLAKPEIHQRNKQSPGNYCTSIKLCVIYSSVVQK